MKVLYLSVLAGAMAAPVSACDLCSIYSATYARGEIGKGYYTSLAEQFTHFGTLQENGSKQPNEIGQALDSSVSQIVAGYNLSERFGLQLNLPVIHRSFTRAEGFDIERGNESGIGDLALVGNFQLYGHSSKENTIAWNVLGGIKLPTGSSDRLAEELKELTEPEPGPGAPNSGVHGHDLTLGSGSLDGVVGTGVYLRRARYFLSANMQYAIRTKGDFDYHFADDLTWSGGPGYYLVLDEDYTLALHANVSGEHKERDTFRGARVGDTGLTMVYLGPQISFTWLEKLSGEISVDLPVSRENTALQIVPDYRVRAGLTWRF